jgi:Ca-activated chloride channel family protein
MRSLVILLVLALIVPLISAQSRRVTPAGGGKSNTRGAEPSPTPVVDSSAGISEEKEIVKIDTNVVTVPVRVIDRRGRFVAGLNKEDFKVFEDGVEQEIAYFSSEQDPFTVALVLDMSYSTKFQIADIQSAAISFIDQLGPRDKIMVVSFDQDVHVLCEPTNDRSQIYRAIRSTKIGTGTSLYEAVDLVMNDRMKHIKGRKAIILFTDGVDTTSTRSNDLQNLGDAMELDALIYPIRYDTFQDVQAMKDKPVIINQPTVNTGPFPTKHPNGNPLPLPIPTIGAPGGPGTTAEDYKRAEEYLDQLALRTGGRMYLADSFGNLAGAYSKIASELREYYSLGFYPQNEADTGKVRKLKVRVDKPGLAVRARDSYVVGKRAKGKSHSLNNLTIRYQ